MRKIVSLITAVIISCGFTVHSYCSVRNIPRDNYPRPQFERREWKNLNGEWSYVFDFARSGMDRKLFESKGFDKKIMVPFCPQSKLSGVGYRDFISGMWYHRIITVPDSWKGRKILLHFQAVDYFAGVYVDGRCVAEHWGGSTPFSADISAYADGKNHDLVVRVEDDERGNNIPRGKQSSDYYSSGCSYTRTTGIWQTVWMESVSNYGLSGVYIKPDPDQGRFVADPSFYALYRGEKLRVTVYDGKKKVCVRTIDASDASSVILPVRNAKLWSPESPFLYDFVFEAMDSSGKIIDSVRSYSGMRKVSIIGNRIYLNNEPYYLRLVLEQGFYPDGIWTAPSDAAMKHDIELALLAGFNGARLHQKVFDERFLYWADKLGYLVWDEFPNWGADVNYVETETNFLPEWTDVVKRDRNHPSIIAWTPFNETWEMPSDKERAKQARRIIRDVYKVTHDLDYRPVNDASGLYHVVTDLWTVHNYEQDPEKLSALLSGKDGRLFMQDPKREADYNGQPYLIDEYGGLRWIKGQKFSEKSWGYGRPPRSPEEFYLRLEKLTDAILGAKHVCGYCYTQFTDVEQEQNGIYNYDRSEKFDMKRIHDIFAKTPEGYSNSSK
ncbi:MAG: beta-glucuronidase [Bacteroidales bacterium]|jgi:beta-galactosidase/beta-glucuronidase|nr:beta-glucuronidase [Bacteroidales bacterium]